MQTSMKRIHEAERRKEARKVTAPSFIKQNKAVGKVADPKISQQLLPAIKRNYNS